MVIMVLVGLEPLINHGLDLVVLAAGVAGTAAAAATAATVGRTGRLRGRSGSRRRPRYAGDGHRCAGTSGRRRRRIHAAAGIALGHLLLRDLAVAIGIVAAIFVGITRFPHLLVVQHA